MQLVTLEDLEKLAAPLQESDDALAPGMSFKDVCKEYERCKKSIPSSSKANWRRYVYDKLNTSYLRSKCPPIELIGAGSSRVAYACIGGKCLKLAVNDAGAAQSQHEWKYTKKHWWSRGWSCFVQTYGSNKDFGLLMSECCAKVESTKQLVDAFGISSGDVFNAVVKAVSADQKHDISSASSSLKDMATDWRHQAKDFSSMSSYAEVAENAAAWLDGLAKNGAENQGQKSFLQLVKFWKKNGVDQLLPGDVKMAENWGFAIRDGKVTPVMLDVGFATDIARKYYNL